LDRANPYAIFLSHEWASAWFAAFGKDRTPCILTVHDGPEMLGVLPMHAGRSQRFLLPTRDLQLMANGHSPYADMVAKSGHERTVRDALATYLRQNALDWHAAVLPEIAGDATLATLPHCMDDSRCGIQHQRSAPFIPLQDSWDVYRNRLSKRFVKVLRNNHNRVTRDATTEIELLETTEDILAGLDDAFAIGEKSWQGESGSAIGSNAANRNFYRELVRVFAPRQQVRLWFLKRNGDRVAFELHMREGGVEFGLKTGFDRAFEKIGIGTFLDQSILERLFADRTLHEYDLLGDFDFYKQRWTTQARPYYRVTLYGGNWPARAAALWNLRLLPLLRQQQWLRQLRDLAAARPTVRQES
jgi:CelD/BcsL family acetyltransferase involved in cellulose biosynthesis